jgi:anhydro-N-acetylmuramic acid kinase
MSLVVGVMMGTSADGIDVAVCRIESEADSVGERVHLECFRSEPLDAALRGRILHLCTGLGTVAQVCQANFDIGNAIAAAVHRTLELHRVPTDAVLLVASHGQTIWHQLDRDSGGRTTSTLQIGEAACIAARLGLPVVSDFRVADVAAGGNGAPLAPIFDDALLRPRSLDEGHRALLNIGGISNVAVVGHERALPPVAFDCGPGGCLIDRAATLLFGGGVTMDRDGAFARAGRVCEPLLAETMLALDFFRVPPPKSTGRELFSEALFDEWWRIARERHALTREDFICTLTELTARAVVDSLARFCADAAPRQLFVAGGGAHNRFLMERLAALLAPHRCSVHSHDELFSGDAKEAALFALLGYRCWHRRPSTTAGAVLGKLQHPPAARTQ